jgi:hypothetical protein
MPATFDNRFTMPGDVPFTMPGDSVFATEDPDELLGRLWVAGSLDETILPPERKEALAAWKKKLLARTARETGARVVGAEQRASGLTPEGGGAAAPGPDAAEPPGSIRRLADEAAARKQARNAKGQFAPGNPGGPGNPFGRKVAALRARLLNRATEDDWDTIADALIEKARAGDTAATKLCYQYTLGKPAQAVDPDRADIDEANLLEAARKCVDLAKNLIRTLPLETMLGIIHIMQEVCENTVLADIKRGVDDGNRKDELRAKRAAKAAERREKRRAAATQPQQTAPGEPTGVSPRVNGDTVEQNSQSAAAKEACAVESAVPGATTHPAADAARLAEPAQPVAPPSTNGRNGHRRPSKGVSSAPCPSKTPGVPPSELSPNGRNGEVEPSANGPNGAAPPSPNEPNGDVRSPWRWYRDAKGRFAAKPNGAAPSPNGDKR